MAGFMTFILVLHLALGLLSTALALPLIRRNVAPNALYGFRTRKTREDPATWYEANAFAGRCMLGFGVGISLACLALYFFPAIDPIVYAVACLVIVLVGLAAALVLSFRFLNRLPR